MNSEEPRVFRRPSSDIYWPHVAGRTFSSHRAQPSGRPLGSKGCALRLGQTRVNETSDGVC